MTLQAVPPGHLATVVSALEMRTRPRPSPLPASRLRIERRPLPTTTAYRTLFRRVGARWLWYSRLVLSDDQLTDTLRKPWCELYVVLDNGIEVGMFELDFEQPGECALLYFALVPELTGQGHGRWLMAHALSRGWRRDTRRMHLRTCTLDHPSALNFYRRQGFEVVARAVETFADPRLTGHLPPDAAPQIALLS